MTNTALDVWDRNVRPSVETAWTYFYQATLAALFPSAPATGQVTGGMTGLP